MYLTRPPTVALALVCALAMVSTAALAQSDSIAQRIESAYVLTKPTADMTDIVKQGDALVLKKDDLFMCDISSGIPSYNTYKRGKIHQSLLNKMKFFTASGSAPTVPTRMFVAGEKVMLTDVETLDDGVRLSLLSDNINGHSYKAYLVLPFSKGSPPSPDTVLQTLKEVVSVAPPTQPAPVASQARTLSVGQTKDQVIAILGQPTTVVKLSNSKEIYYFPTMKVTFNNGHVSNVQ